MGLGTKLSILCVSLVACTAQAQGIAPPGVATGVQAASTPRGKAKNKARKNVSLSDKQAFKIYASQLAGALNTHGSYGQPMTFKSLKISTRDCMVNIRGEVGAKKKPQWFRFNLLRLQPSARFGASAWNVRCDQEKICIKRKTEGQPWQPNQSRISVPLKGTKGNQLRAGWGTFFKRAKKYCEQG